MYFDRGENMKTIDRLGRIVIPSEIRKRIYLELGDEVEFEELDGAVIVKTVKKHCRLCGSVEEFNPRLRLCNKCVEQIKNEP